ncbi:MAG: PilZ domain-containing protein [Deltaproteobacteria bacterium]|nr:PilZ domain-containing protein [Deltaproteobacteria bacterium]
MDIHRTANDSGIIDRIMEQVKRLSPDDQEDLLLELERRASRNRRYHPRKPYFMIVDYATPDRNYGDFIKNISESGVFIQTRIPFAVGQNISLTFPLPDRSKHIKVRGKIIRTNEEGIGVEFLMTEESRQDMIRALLEML